MDKQNIKRHFEGLADERGRWLARNAYCHGVLRNFFRSQVRPTDSVIDFGCGDGDILDGLTAGRKVGLDIAEAMIRKAKAAYPDIAFEQHDCEVPYHESQSFDVVILSNVVEFSTDIVALFEAANACLRIGGRICICTINPLLDPILGIAERLGLKMPDREHNYVPNRYLEAILAQRGFDRIRRGSLLIAPWKVPWISDVLNWLVPKLPFFYRFCIVQTLTVQKVSDWDPKVESDLTCSVVVPCYNEVDNIEHCVARIPSMGKRTEVLLVDDGSSDDTLSVARRVEREDARVRVVSHSPNRGKGYAVRRGLEEARGDIVMILDADMTVMPEELPLFFNAIALGQADFANGTRMIYPMEQKAMRILNQIGNLFFGNVVSWLLSQPVSDTLCGTKALRREDAIKIEMKRDTWGDFDLLFGAAENRLRIVDIPVHYRARIGGASKMKPFKHSVILLKVCFSGFLRLKCHLGSGRR